MSENIVSVIFSLSLRSFVYIISSLFSFLPLFVINQQIFEQWWKDGFLQLKNHHSFVNDENMWRLISFNVQIPTDDSLSVLLICLKSILQQFIIACMAIYLLCWNEVITHRHMTNRLIYFNKESVLKSYP